MNKKNLLEGYHDAIQAVDEALTRFSVGSLHLEMRALVERLYWAVCGKALKIVREMDFVPEELENLESMISDTYFCNFSIFQSMPDSWAIKQLFPILPIHRLNEVPTRRGVLGDITCDSDGKIDQFSDLRDVRSTLELHPFNGEPYYLGAFLLGAYQEILGDLHNLFGDTNAVHVRLSDDDDYEVSHVVKGDSIHEVLDYVEYEPSVMVERMRLQAERAKREGRITVDQVKLLLKHYEESLGSYTYLTDD
jgi:arginine decarboxylase